MKKSEQVRCKTPIGIRPILIIVIVIVDGSIEGVISDKRK